MSPWRCIPQVPAMVDGELPIFESGAILVRPGSARVAQQM
jgi:hypothetical protein